MRGGYLSNCTSSGADNMKLFNPVSSNNNESSNEVEVRLAIIRGGLKVRIGRIVEFYMEQLSIPCFDEMFLPFSFSLALQLVT
jgi:hypothetical protein